MNRASFLLLALPLLAQAAPQVSQKGKLQTLPFSHGNLIYTTRLSGDGSTQFCVQDGLTGDVKPLLSSRDYPALLKTPVDQFCLSPDGSYAVTFEPQNVKGYEQISILDTRTGKPLAEKIPWTFQSDLAWTNSGFYYGQYPVPTKDTVTPLNEVVKFHQIGAPVGEDKLIYQDASHSKQFYLFLTGSDLRWLHFHFLSEFSRNRTLTEWVCPADGSAHPLTPILGQPAFVKFILCEDTDQGFIYFTNYKAPNGRITLVDPQNPAEQNWKDMVPEGNEMLTDAECCAGKLILTYAPNRVVFCNMQGQREDQLPIPTGASVDLQWGSPTEPYIFFSEKSKDGQTSYFAYDGKTKSAIPFE